MSTLDMPTFTELAAAKLVRMAKKQRRESAFSGGMVFANALRIVLHIAGFTLLTIAGFTFSMIAGYVVAAVSCFVLSTLMTVKESTTPPDPIMQGRR